VQKLYAEGRAWLAGSATAKDDFAVGS
jgi:hypothetical protein